MPCSPSNVSFFCDELIKNIWTKLDYLHVAVFALGLLVTLIGLIGLLVNCCFEISPKRQLQEQIARLRDHQLRDPICHLKGRMLGVQMQDWKDYFSMPRPLAEKKVKKKKKRKLSFSSGKNQQTTATSEKKEQPQSSNKPFKKAV